MYVTIEVLLQYTDVIVGVVSAVILLLTYINHISKK